MSGRGKGAKKKSNIPRRQRVSASADHVAELTDGTIRRLTRKGNNKRTSRSVYDPLRKIYCELVRVQGQAACEICLGRGKKTVSISDVVHGLKSTGNVCYMSY